MARSLGLLLLILLALFNGGRAGAQTTPPPSEPSELAEQGARLYAENCAMCHGPEGQGRVGATLAKDWPSIRPDLTVRAIIANGVPGSAMPAWSQAKGGPLSEEEVNDLTAFILALGEQSPVEQLPTPTGGLPPVGASPWGGWGGVALFFALVVGLFGLALLVQRRRAQ